MRILKRLFRIGKSNSVRKHNHMAYWRQEKLTVLEAIRLECLKGFESQDEKREVLLEIAQEYGLEYGDVVKLYRECSK